MSEKDDLRFTKTEEQEVNEAFADIPKNKTLLVAKLTNDPAMRPEVVEDLKTMEEVFENYQPEVDVNFQNEAGEEVRENLRFRTVGDFGKKGITNQSAFLQGLSQQQSDYQSFEQKLKANRTLQTLLGNPEAKAAYITALQAMIAELEAENQQ